MKCSAPSSLVRMVREAIMISEYDGDNLLNDILEYNRFLLPEITTKVGQRRKWLRMNKRKMLTKQKKQRQIMMMKLNPMMMRIIRRQKPQRKQMMKIRRQRKQRTLHIFNVVGGGEGGLAGVLWLIFFSTATVAFISIKPNVILFFFFTLSRRLLY